MEKNENGYSEYFTRNSGNGCSLGGAQNGSRGNSCPCPNNRGGSADGAEWRGGEACASPSLAMVYSPTQKWRMLYGVEDALTHGTLFEELYKPLEDCYGK